MTVPYRTLCGIGPGGGYVEFVCQYLHPETEAVDKELSFFCILPTREE